MSQSIPYWHSLPGDKVTHHLQSSTEKGLSTAQVVERKTQFGSNRFVVIKKQAAFLRFIKQFHHPLVYLLFITCGITFSLNQKIDTVIILVVIFANAWIGFFQEGQAERLLNFLRHRLVSKANVIRDRKMQLIDAVKLVPGDIVFIKSGDKIPADLRLLEVQHLMVQEALLTGESLPIAKHAHPVANDTALSERTCMAYGGTIVQRGRGCGIVVAIGKQTEMGRIQTAVAEIASVSTPLLKQLTRSSRQLSLIIIAIALLFVVTGLIFQVRPNIDVLMTGVAFTVAAIPEGLPALLTIILAVGVKRMAKHHVIVRRLPAVEIMGGIDVICTDKTGTLTRNELMVQTIITRDCAYDVAVNSEETIIIKDTNGKLIDLSQSRLVQEIIHTAMLCNEATYDASHGQWQGDALDVALMQFAMDVEVPKKEEEQRYFRLDIIPFECEYQLMATLHESKKETSILVKGAPEKIMAICHPNKKKYWLQQLNKISQLGQRVLAVATCSVKGKWDKLRMSDLEHGFTLLGFIGLIDPPRPEAIAAIAECKAAGIRVKMITGDHPETARCVAEKINLINTQDVLTGIAMDRLSEQQLQQLVLSIDVYARTLPLHKLKLVEALQKQGYRVAMTGDGMNDAPALKRADIGIAMGLKGSEGSREAAEMVLMDDNFASIAKTVTVGRTVYANIRKALLFALPSDFGEAVLVLLATFMGIVMPITPLQVLWVNTVTAITLGLVLAFEPPERNLMQQPPVAFQGSPLSVFLGWRIFFITLLVIGSSLWLVNLEIRQHLTLQLMRTTVVNLIVAVEIFYLLNCRQASFAFQQPRFFKSNPMLWIGVGSTLCMQSLFTYVPVMQHFFATATLRWLDWAIIFVMAAGIFIVVEVEKIIIRIKM